MFFILYQGRFFHLGYLNVLYICSLINKLYARRKYQSNVQVYVTANYEINKNANFFSSYRMGNRAAISAQRKKDRRRFYLSR